MKRSWPKVGEYVTWRWANGIAEGEVLEVIPGRSEIVSKGSYIVRNGTKDNPAIIILHPKSGNEVIKLASELMGYKE